MAECHCHRCIKENQLGTEIGGVFMPLSALQMIVCPGCGDKRCVHAYDHRAPCAKADIYAHNAWVLDEISRLREEREQLAAAIRNAAVTAGICREDVDLTGPELLVLCGDMGSALTT